MTTIYDSKGKAKAEVSAISGSTRKFALGGDDYVTLKFTVGEPLYICRGDYIDVENVGRYIIIDEQLPTIDSSTGGYTYELKFQAEYKIWQNFTSMLVYKKSDGAGGVKQYRKESDWSLTADITTQVQTAIIDNLNVLGITYHTGEAYTFALKGDIPEDTKTKSELVDYSQTSILDALASIADTFEVEWWVVGNIIYLGKCQYGEESEAVALTYGDNVSSMGNTKASGTLATRYYVFGSDKNLRNYRKGDRGESVALGVVTDRLMLPSGIDYIDAYKYNTKGERVYITDEHYNDADNTPMPDSEVIESTIIFDEVYPRTECHITEVKIGYYVEDEEDDGTTTKFPIYQIRVNKDEFFFNRKYLLEGQTMQILPNSGSLNGMTFDVSFNPNYEDETIKQDQQWGIARNEDYGRYLPDTVLMPAVGDEVHFVNFDSKLITETDIIAKAEQELYDTAVDYIKEQTIDNQTYTCTIMCDVAQSGFTLDVGQRVVLDNPGYFRTPRKSRVIGWEIPFDIPYDSPKYSIGEEVAYSTIGSITTEVDALVAQGQKRDAESQSIYLIRSNDKTTPASDINAYSALRALRQFVSAVDDDTVAGLLDYDKGLQSSGFLQGEFGNGFELIKSNNNGNSYLEVDELFVRLRATFASLEIKHISHVGGEQILSPAGIECSSVEVAEAGDFLLDSDGYTLTDSDGYTLVDSSATEKVYRCYFKTTDGDKTIYNEFEVGDLARCQEFNTKYNNDGSVTLGRSYWRAVVGVGDDYIDLSMTDCMEGSDVPMKGDTIVCLGNHTDTSRQNAIAISSYSADAPSMKMYQKISGFKLSDDNAPIIISPSGNKFTGDFVSTSGESLVSLISGKAKIYYTDPTGEAYKKGDVWVNATFTNGLVTYTNEMVVCISDALEIKGKYQFNAADWRVTNGYTSKIEQEADRISLKVFSLGTSARNYATTAQTMTPTPVFDSSTAAPYVHLGKFIVEGLTNGQKVYLSATFKTTAGINGGNLTLQIRNGSNVLYSKAITVTKSATKTTTLTDEVLAITNEWLLDANNYALDALDIVVKATNVLLFPMVEITDFRICNVTGADYAEATETKLMETGIDIVDRKIKLTADNVSFVSNDGTESVQIFTTEGRIKADRIDTDELTAKRLECESDEGNITIQNGVISMCDSSQTPKLRISGGSILNTDTTTEIELTDAAIEWEGGTKIEVASNIEIVGNETTHGATFTTKANAQITLPKFEVGAALTAMEPQSPQDTLAVWWGFYLDGVLLGGAWTYADASSEKCSYNKVITPSPSTFALADGVHTFNVRCIFDAGANEINNANISITPKGSIAVTHPKDLVEIGADGFRAASSASSYLLNTQNGTEIKFKDYILAVNADGIRVSNDGGSKWTTLIK